MKATKHIEDPNLYCECIECDPDQYKFETYEDYVEHRLETQGEYLLPVESVKCDDCQEGPCAKHDRKV